MIRSTLGLRAPTVLLVLLVAGGAAAAPVAGPRIDLGLPDPPGLEELPGIDESEIVLLREISGPGFGDLGDRLSTTGIAQERLRIWAPYLEISDAEAAPLRGKLRISCEARPARPVRSQMRCSLDHGRIHWESLLEQSAPETQGTKDVLREARVAIEVGPSASFWVGSLTGGIQGANPWEDPMGGALRSSVLQPCLRVRSSRTARGIALMNGAFGAAAWMRDDKRRGLLLRLARNRDSVWLGRISRRGEGAGGCFELGGVRCVACAWRSDGTAPVVGLRFQSVARPRHAGIQWAIGESESQARARFDAGTTERVGAVRVRLALAVLSEEPGTRSSSRGEIELGWYRGSRRASGEGRWDGRRARFQAAYDVPVRSSYRLHLEGRSIASVGRVPALFCLVPSRESRTMRLELAVLGRTGEDQPWPGTSVAESAGRVALRFAVTPTSGAVRIRALLLAPVQSGGRVVCDDLLWQLSVEQRGG